MAQESYKLTFKVDEADSELVSTMLFDAGCTGIEEKTAVERYAYFDGKSLDTGLTILSAHDIEPVVEKIEERDWDAEWRRNMKPIKISDRFTVVPTWMADTLPEPNRIVMDPKMTFGSGHHETTRLCAQFIEKYSDGVNSILDAGTGTAILAIAAEKLGIKKIVAFDNDPETRENTLENLALNSCSRIEYFTGTLDNVSTKSSYDLISANIISSVLYELMAKFKLVLNPSGKIIFSGILVHEQEEFRRRLKMNGFNLIEEATDKEWYACVASV
ncbi:MAG: 50S ribosomal protein L11 methyltransferase [Fibrobacteres bacterium]|nr:50S ribosomal protein L11 methyltransferase [Fibrobacterota bacterium]